MKKLWQRLPALVFILLVAVVTGCGPAASADVQSPNAPAQAQPVKAQETQKNIRGGEDSMNQVKLKITVDGHVMTATLEDNATAKAFVKKLPVTLPMSNLYGREMCYRYGVGGLDMAAVRADRYAVGDLVYWPPRGSFVILYKQNGEEFERVQLGHIDQGVDIFAGSGDLNVRFELLE